MIFDIHCAFIIITKNNKTQCYYLICAGIFNWWTCVFHTLSHDIKAVNCGYFCWTSNELRRQRFTMAHRAIRFVLVLLFICCESTLGKNYQRNSWGNWRSRTPRKQCRRCPNIVFVLSDDIGYPDIGYHGGSGQGLKTPVLDKLAAEGVKLENYYVQPICTPTRGSWCQVRVSNKARLPYSIHSFTAIIYR